MVLVARHVFLNALWIVNAMESRSNSILDTTVYQITRPENQHGGIQISIPFNQRSVPYSSGTPIHKELAVIESLRTLRQRKALAVALYEVRISQPHV